MVLEKLLFVAAESARSQSYAQAMEAEGIRVEKAILYSNREISDGAIDDSNASKEYQARDINGIRLPNLETPLKKTCQAIADEVVELRLGNVNDDLILEILCSSKPDLVIYSGYGGQIVSDKLLNVAPFLHVHAGWLPQYRGSTTIYYSILKERNCGVSAILLEPEIDTGAVIIRRHFPLPSADIDIDHEYDGAIRAAVLLEALNEWAQHRKFPQTELQSDTDSETYYVIHPVLKHIAILSLPDEQ